MNSLVVGGNRGLGLEIVKKLSERKDNVFVSCRKSNDTLKQIDNVQVVENIDLLDERCGELLCQMLKGCAKFDRLYLVAGYFYTGETFDELSWEEEIKMYKICAMAPLAITQALVRYDLLGPGAKICLVTSEGGSIGLRTEEEGGAHYGHHMSKAAENMMGKILSLDLKPKEISLVMVHPGFLKTDMTSHYAHLYEKFGAVTPDEAVAPILTATEQVTLDTTGRFIAPLGADGLGLGAMALPEGFKPFDQIPW